MSNTPSQKMRESSVVEKISIKITQAVGTPISIIVHTLLFIGIFSLKELDYTTEEILLILTTIVSLEAIYLSIFIQMSVNRQGKRLSMVRKDIKEISEDIEEIQEDVEELGEDFDEISEDMEADDKQEELEKKEHNQQIQKIEATLQTLLKDIEELRAKK
jgi:uncharacterized membrane protein